jgi:diaminopimelate epimerase
MTGAGNDFVLIDDRNATLNLRWGELAPGICDRRYGIGADGLLILEVSTLASISMRYYNADGSYGGMCGNGGRCVARYLMNEMGSDRVDFEALGHVYTGQACGEDVTLKMTDPKKFQRNVLVKLDGSTIEMHFIDTGAPHAVRFVGNTLVSNREEDNLDSVPVGEMGKKIRFAKEFAPSGTNVDFVQLLENGIRMRTYERGVEGETFACGTGAVASALITSALFGWNSPINVHTRSNEILTVSFGKDGDAFTNIALTGSARITFSGRIRLDSVLRSPHRDGDR